MKLGHLSASELTRITAPFLHTSDTLLHQHNQLILTIQTNSTREPPEPGVAPWVSANDKPTSTAKPLAGDAAEQRLKTEVMQLPPRVRARIKAVNDEPSGPLIAGLASEAAARRPPVQSSAVGGVSTPLTATIPPASASSSSTGLNKDQEIRKRYTQPLMQESQDLPGKSAILDRLLPMCYEERLSEGVSNPGQVASLVSAAVNNFVKESLGALLSVARTNPPISDPVAGFGQEADDHSGAGVSAPGIFTAGYKKRVRRETISAARGEIKRTETGLLPVEVQAQKRANWGRGREGDFKLAWELREPKWWHELTPWAAERMHPIREPVQGEDEDEMLVDGVGAGVGLLNGMPKRQGLPNGMQPNAVNGANGVTVNGDTTMTNHDREPGEDAMDIDEMDWGWQGASAADRGALASVLDDCLNF